LLKPHGYATGQFGKNHFGDVNKYLPTVHGFDEFYGNLADLDSGGVGDLDQPLQVLHRALEPVGVPADRRVEFAALHAVEESLEGRVRCGD
jgi:arylsulfatase